MSSAVDVSAHRTSLGRPQVALVHDYLTQRGGAERVVLAMVRAFPDAPLYTSLYSRNSTFPELQAADVRTLPMNSLPGLRHNHRFALPLLADAFHMAKVDAAVTLISSSGWAHGIRTTGRKIVYCYAPARWLYESDRYLGSRRGVRSAALRAFSPLLISWDRRAARSAHRYLCVSTTTQQRIRERYGIDAEVLHPPPSLSPSGKQSALPDIEPGFILCVSRLLPYKNVDAVIRASETLPERRFVIVGQGPELSRLRAKASSNVRFTGTVDDAQLRWLYASCTGLVAPAHEDYGLTILEAGAFGKPAAALRAGGYLDTVIEGQTGVFFDHPEPVAIGSALRELVTREWSSETLRQQAARFDETAFAARLHQVVKEEAARA